MSNKILFSSLLATASAFLIACGDSGNGGGTQSLAGGVESFDDHVEFEILEMSSKKVFGLFGGRPAKVRAFIVIEEAPDDKTERFLRDVLDKMGLPEIAIEKKTEEDSLEFNLSGEEEGFVIGRRGETLDALQYLASLVANHNNENYVKVSVNVGNYRDKREKTLEILGRKLAFKAVKTGKKTSLEPMNPYERRIIHTAVQKVNGAISWSEGNPDRVPLNEGGKTGLYGRIDK